MKLKVDPEFKEVCKEIVNRELTIFQCELIESYDMFQTDNYNGGFDATESEFCFSYYDQNKREYWFQVSLSNIEKILTNDIEELEIRVADKK
ncbi:hypothetical protein [uncultured Aquimarina sp.]|uniref:hypothetical protein n=1 Tax=uncultured Aquimarina sp. TaxID=575652 RepID=UPI00260E23CE|nr:hypothetical protein [uncultured Aquimarina sp.]